MSLAIWLGDLLYRRCFPLYNIAYPRFKRRKDREELRVVEERVRPGDHVLDVGANIGFYARVLASRVGPEGRVYCFEPDRVNFGHLERNTASLGNVVRFNLAVSDRNGPMKVYRSKLLNVDHRTYPVEDAASTEDIEGAGIDALIASGQIERVDFVKIDVQGFEVAAFRGMRGLLDGPRRVTILSEVWPHGLRQAGSSAVELFDFFDRLRYRIRQIGKDGLRDLDRGFFVGTSDSPRETFFNVLIERSS